MDQAEHLHSLCEPQVGNAGYELVWVQVTGGGGRRKITFFIDKEGGVSVDDCVVVSRLVDPLIEESGIFTGSYTLEVSSPGLERPLFRAADYRRFAGRKAYLTLRIPLDRRRRFTGTLRGITDESQILLELEDGVREEIPLDSVQKANLVFEWK